MAQFLVLYRSTVSARDQLAGADPDQAREGMAAWMAWAQRAGEHIVDLGSPLAPAAQVGGGSGTVQPEQPTGFSVLRADSTDAVVALLDGHPHLRAGGSVEVLEFLPLPGM